jgi:hypothetical protein
MSYGRTRRIGRGLSQIAVVCSTLAGVTLLPGCLLAQVDVPKTGAPKVDSVKARPRRAPTAMELRLRPPLSPRRAFVTSAVLPGLGQAKLDRGSSGALFAAVELASLVMLRRSAADFREAKRFQVDTLPTNFTVGTDGKATGVGQTISRYTGDLVRTRRLHHEDWIAVVAFNHLFSAADAFVSAQLYDIPVQLSAAPTRNGAALVATLRF